MTRFAIIDAGRVVNHAVADPAFAAERGWIPAGESRIGDLWDGTNFLPPPPAPAPVPTSCTPAQGLIALYALQSITEQDVLDAIAQIPDPVQRYTAQVGYSRAITWERESQTMQALAALLNLSDAELDALFAYAVGVQV